MSRFPCGRGEWSKIGGTLAAALVVVMGAAAGGQQPAAVVDRDKAVAEIERRLKGMPRAAGQSRHPCR